MVLTVSYQLLINYQKLYILGIILIILNKSFYTVDYLKYVELTSLLLHFVLLTNNVRHISIKNNRNNFFRCKNLDICWNSRTNTSRRSFWSEYLLAISCKSRSRITFILFLSRARLETKSISYNVKAFL